MDKLSDARKAIEAVMREYGIATLAAYYGSLLHITLQPSVSETAIDTRPHSEDCAAIRQAKFWCNRYGKLKVRNIGDGSCSLYGYVPKGEAVMAIVTVDEADKIVEHGFASWA